MAKVDLTLGQSRTKVDLTLATKGSDLTWDEATWSWDDAEGNWNGQNVSLTLASKTKVDLTLASK
jgi:hypothetical protein